MTHRNILQTGALLLIGALGLMKVGSLYWSGPATVSLSIPAGTTLTVRADRIGDTIFGTIIESSRPTRSNDAGVISKLVASQCKAVLPLDDVPGRFHSKGDTVLHCDQGDLSRVKAKLFDRDGNVGISELTVGAEYDFLMLSAGSVEALDRPQVQP